MLSTCIRLSEKFLSFRKCNNIVDARHFLFYIILFYGFMYDPFCSNRIKWIEGNSIK